MGAPTFFDAHVLRLWRAERARRDARLHLVATGEDEGRPYAERAAALAFYGRHGAVGDAMPASWPSAPPPPSTTPDSERMPPAGSSCPVCFEDFVDVLPSPDPASRAPPGRWARGDERCPHALCRGCDIGVQRAARVTATRCPECRRPRRLAVRAPP